MFEVKRADKSKKIKVSHCDIKWDQSKAEKQGNSQIQLFNLRFLFVYEHHEYDQYRNTQTECEDVLVVTC